MVLVEQEVKPKTVWNFDLQIIGLVHLFASNLRFGLKTHTHEVSNEVSASQLFDFFIVNYISKLPKRFSDFVNGQEVQTQFFVTTEKSVPEEDGYQELVVYMDEEDEQAGEQVSKPYVVGYWRFSKPENNNGHAPQTSFEFYFFEEELGLLSRDWRELIRKLEAENTTD